VIANLVFAMLTAAMTLALIQLVRSSSLPERVVALDLMATLAVGFIVTYAVSTDQPVFLDVAVVLALIAFLGTVAFAYFIEKGDMPWGRS
jgi:multicomponent Na+:H+ antiporter subunit F